MSGAAAQPATDPPVVEPGGAESIARRWGWKPKEEFAGDPTKWVDAGAFVERARETPAVLLNRVQVMDRKMTGMEAELKAAREAVNSMTDMVRRSDERGYRRARSELMEQRDRAIEAGDKATVHTIDAGLQELDASKPPAAPTRTEKPAAEAPTGVQPEVQRFYADNPWYTTDPEMRQEADAIHVGLIQTRKDLTLEENLKIVGDRMRRLFPDKFASGRRTDPPVDPEQDPPARGNARRDDPPAVTPSADPGGRAPRRAARSYETMPAEAKSAYTRYAKMLSGKGAPLTKEEYAADYWAQFEEV